MYRIHETSLTDKVAVIKPTMGTSRDSGLSADAKASMEKKWRKSAPLQESIASKDAKIRK